MAAKGEKTVLLVQPILHSELNREVFDAVKRLLKSVQGYTLEILDGTKTKAVKHWAAKCHSNDVAKVFSMRAACFEIDDACMHNPKMCVKMQRGRESLFVDTVRLWAKNQSASVSKPAVYPEVHNYNKSVASHPATLHPLQSTKPKLAAPERAPSHELPPHSYGPAHTDPSFEVRQRDPVYDMSRLGPSFEVAHRAHSPYEGSHRPHSPYDRSHHEPLRRVRTTTTDLKTKSWLCRSCHKNTRAYEKTFDGGVRVFPFCSKQCGGAERVAPKLLYGSKARDFLKRFGSIEFYERSRPFYQFTNFFLAPFKSSDGRTWPTSEHYFQAHKFVHFPMILEEVRHLATPRLAFEAARWYHDFVHPDWERGAEGAKFKDEVMRKAVLYKFKSNQKLKETLLNTGTRKLVEHTRNDCYWGDGGDGSGKNRLGCTLEEVRAILRAESGQTNTTA